MTHSHIVVGLAFGDEGKGSWVDHLVRKHGIKYVVRFNGGSQAAHHVVTPEGATHCFAQFGSGTLVPGTATILSRFMLVDPEAWLKEAARLVKLGVNFEGLVLVSENAPIISPFNRILNRIQEVSRGGSRHGSCGFGIGITQGDVETLGEQALYARDLLTDRLAEKLAWLRERRFAESERYESPLTTVLRAELISVDLSYYAELFQYFSQRVRIVSDDEIAHIIANNSTVFEGAQGVLLDQRYGTFPHCTRSNTTLQNAEALLQEAGFKGDVEKIGLLRGYGTRHGAGPLVTEDNSLPIPACHNALNEWQGQFRIGWFDAVMARYALEVVGKVDTLAITNLDRMRGLDRIQIATRYENTVARFFSASGDSMNVLPNDLKLSQERTGTMGNLVPVYQATPGFGTHGSKGVENHLDILAEAMGHQVHAYSESIDHRKVYRRSSNG